MKKRIVACTLALVMAFSITACGNDKNADKKENTRSEEQEEKVTAERGTFEGNVYTNKSMGIQVTFPEGCTMYSDEEIQQVVGKGSDIMEEAYDSKAIEGGISETIYDVIAVTADQTANIQIIMENTKNTAGRALTSAEYAKVMTNNLKKAYESAGVDAGDAEITEETLDGLEFSKISISVNGMIQEYYAHQVGQYMLVFTITYADTAADAVQQFLDSVTAI